MKIFLVSISAIFCFTFSSCNINCVEGSGNVVSKTLNLNEFTELELNSSIQVNLRQGSEQKVEVKAQENLIHLLNKQVDGDTWEIEFTECVNNAGNFQVFVTVPELDRIELNGSGSISTGNVLKGEIFEVNLDGSGDMALQLQVKELSTKLNGSGDLKLIGSTKTHSIDLDGSGDISAENLKSDNVSINLDGSGDVRVKASYELDIKVNGSGDVYYEGNVKSINSEINGSGNLHQISN